MIGVVEVLQKLPYYCSSEKFHTHPFISDVISLHENPLFLKNICHAAGIIHINQECILKGRFEVPY